MALNIGPRRVIGLSPGKGGGVPDPFAAAVYDMDFKRGAYKGGLVTDLLNELGNYVGGLYELESTGALQAIGGSTLQITGNGLEVWPNRNNYLIQNRNITSASWTKTGVTAARSTGRNGAANAASRLTVTADGGTAMLAAVTLASTQLIGSVDVARVSGSGTIEMTLDGGLTWVALSGVTSSYSRLSIPARTLANPQFGFRFGTSGDIFDLDYAQAEDGNTVSPRIATTTATVFRPQNRATCLNKPPLVNLINSGVFAFYWEGRMGAFGQPGTDVGGAFVSDFGNAGFQIRANSAGALSWGQIGGGSGNPVTANGAFQLNTLQKIAGVRLSDGTSRFSLNGQTVISGTTTSAGTGTHFDIGTNGAGVNNIRNVVNRVSFFNSLSDADLRAITAL